MLSIGLSSTSRTASGLQLRHKEGFARYCASFWYRQYYLLQAGKNHLQWQI